MLSRIQLLRNDGSCYWLYVFILASMEMQEILYAGKNNLRSNGGDK